MSKGLDTYISQYDDIMLLGDLNVESSDPILNNFCNVYNLFSLVTEPTCFKNLCNPSFIDLFLTNRPRSFQSTLTIETSISDLKIYFWEYSFRMNKHIQKPTDMFNKQNITVYLTYIKRFKYTKFSTSHCRSHFKGIMQS